MTALAPSKKRFLCSSVGNWVFGMWNFFSDILLIFEPPKREVNWANEGLSILIFCENLKIFGECSMSFSASMSIKGKMGSAVYRAAHKGWD